MANIRTHRNLFKLGWNGVLVPDGFENGAYDRLADHRPQHHHVYMPQPTEETNGNGLPIGQRGFPYARLWWDRIHFDTFAWWSQWVSENTPAVPIVAVTMAAIDRRVGADGPPNHRMWSTGLLGRIRTLDGSTPMVYNGNEFVEEGGAEVFIWRLGGVMRRGAG